MDTGSTQLPVPLSPEEVDDAKRISIEDILRTRPIYALQGPPGTGKTTLVAWLVREILEDDPVAQILVTAQAHGAVDVLRDKVHREAFRGFGEAQQPLAVRLGQARLGSAIRDEGTVENVSLRILENAGAQLCASHKLMPLQERWLESVNDMIDALRNGTSQSSAPDFCELVKRGANLTYCTTSAGELEALADMTQSFDWSIVEEAGKTHGFDLALPLQAGHRWLLIGDHKQLPPYLFESYSSALDNIDTVIEALWELPGHAGGLLDYELLRTLREYSIEEQNEFRDYAKGWLKTFERIFGNCSSASGVTLSEGGVTQQTAQGSSAGMLWGQHRMHPYIGDLISAAYYNDSLVNCTVEPNGDAIARVKHPFTEPECIKGRAIVWLGTEWCAQNDDCKEIGPPEGKPRYTNPSEAEAIASFLMTLRSPVPLVRPEEIAVLSPYTQQVIYLQSRLAGLRLQTSLTPRINLRRAPIRNTDDPSRELVYTVDSFQGNQSDIIIISLVRNNDSLPGRGLGFLDQAPRFNVLLSRSEKLLVLVGSWDFFCHQVSLVDLDDYSNTLWHWKKVMATLERYFESGQAVKLSADSLSSQPTESWMWEELAKAQGWRIQHSM